MRPIAWLVALTAILILATNIFLRSSLARAELRDLIQTRVSSLLDRKVTVDRVDFTILPLELELEGVAIGGSRATEPDFFDARHIVIDATVESWRPLKLRLTRLEVDHPHLFLDFRPDGTDNLPHAAVRNAGGSGARVSLDSLQVRDGILELADQRLPFSLSAKKVAASLIGTGKLDLQGEVNGQQLELTLPHARPYLGTVAAKVTYSPGQINVVSARFAGSSLAATARGRVRYGTRSEVSIQAQGTAEGGLLDQLGFLAGKIRGRVRFDGGFAWSPEAWGYRGRVSAARLGVFGRQLENLQGRVSGDRHSVRLDIGHASYAGGGVSGTVSANLEQDDYPVDLRLSLVSGRAETLLSDQDIPITGIDCAASGSLQLTFPAEHPDQLDGWAEIHLDAPATAGEAGDRLAMSGDVPLLFEHGILSSRAIHVASADQDAVISGSYDLRASSGRFEIEAKSLDVSRLAALLPGGPPRSPRPPWLPNSGHGEIHAVLELPPKGGPWAEVMLDLAQIQAPGAAADRLHGSFAVSGAGLSSIRLALSQGTGRLEVRGSIPFEEPGGAPPPFSMEIRAQSWPSARASAWLPFDLPLSGPLSGSLRLSGDPNDPTGELDATLAPVRVAGSEWSSLSGLVSFEPKLIRIERLALQAPAGAVSLRGRLLTGAQEVGLDLDLASTPLAVDKLPLVASLHGIPLTGSVELSARITGTMKHPRVDGKLEQRDLALRGHPLGEQGSAELTLHLRQDRLSVAGDLLGLAQLRGAGELTTDGTDLSLSVESRALAKVVAGMTGIAATPVSGELGGELHAKGVFADPDSWKATLRLDRLTVNYQDRHLENQEPVKVRLEGKDLVLDSFYLASPDAKGELVAAGSVHLAGRPRVDLHLESSVDLGWFKPLLPRVDLAGRFEALGRIDGTLADPHFDGQGRFLGARVTLADLGQSFENIRGTVLFESKELVVSDVRAAFAGGSLQVAGSIPYVIAEGGANYRLHASARGITLRYPEGWLLRGDADLTVAGTPEGRTIRGAVTLDRAFYLRDVKLGVADLLQSLFERRRLEVQSTNELLVSTQLNVAIKGSEALRIRNNLADLDGSLDLTVRGSAAKPIAFGRVQMDAGGTLVYGGTEYTIERGQLTFANPYKIEPQLDLVATTKIDNYDVRLNLSGTFDRLNADFSSDPPLPDLEVLALLTTGQASQQAGELTPSAETKSIGAEGFLYGQAASIVASRVNTLFGLDKFRIDPLAHGSGSLSSARVTVGKRLSRDVSVTYSYDPSQTTEQILQVEWQVSPTLALILTQNGDGSYAVDTRWEKSF